jgi:hypothetical protein
VARRAKHGICAITICAAVTSCVQRPAGTLTNSTNDTELEAAIARCLVTTAVGGVLGAAVGRLAGGQRGLAPGAVVGAGAGAAFCAVLTTMDQRDKDEIKRAQMAAAESDAPQVYSYQGNDGRVRQLSAKSSSVPAEATPPSLEANSPASGAAPSSSSMSPSQTKEHTGTQGLQPTDQRICRYVDATFEIKGAGTAELPRQMVCRTPQGDWKPETPKTV